MPFLSDWFGGKPKAPELVVAEGAFTPEELEAIQKQLQATAGPGPGPTPADTVTALACRQWCGAQQQPEAPACCSMHPPAGHTYQ
ncbi:hypothetical protein HaLaN_12609 [Haematococcus lacustris]|uniref:Uncharacterized protein n=1 Tax=Haematococcus lacustris TaxID=44745 RepID=A0A699ZAS1_HAELA|nr:hypothetical protein HaLaN_12609 [Haematococcus lacustris]